MPSAVGMYAEASAATFVPETSRQFDSKSTREFVMLNSAITAIVGFCARRAWLVLLAGLLLTAAAAAYSVYHFSISTNTEDLISDNLAWRQRQSAFSKTFPQKGILVVVTATTPEGAEQAANALARTLSRKTDLYRAVVQSEGGDFFQRNGLLFEPLPYVNKSISGLSGGSFLIETLAADPSLRGTAQALGFAAEGVEGGNLKLDDLAWPLSLVQSTLDDILAGKPATFSWQTLVQGT